MGKRYGDADIIEAEPFVDTIAQNEYFNDEKRFEIQCRLAHTANDVRKIVHVLEETLRNKPDNSLCYAAKHIYNKYIGWALPTADICRLVHDFWKERPSCRLIDMGAGSGFCCLLLEAAGIPADNLLAVDCHHPPKIWATKNSFWTIHRDDNYMVDPHDIFFVAWGYYGMVTKVRDYVARGGCFVIILGEKSDGCTFPCDFFEDELEWQTKSIHVQGPASDFTEHITFNVRKTKKEFLLAQVF